MENWPIYGYYPGLSGPLSLNEIGRITQHISGREKEGSQERWGGPEYQKKSRPGQKRLLRVKAARLSVQTSSLFLLSKPVCETHCWNVLLPMEPGCGHQVLSRFLAKGDCPKCHVCWLMIRVIMKWYQGLRTDLMAFTLWLRKTSAKRPSDECCVTSHHLKWDPLLQKDIGRIREKEGWKGQGRDDMKCCWNVLLLVGLHIMSGREIEGKRKVQRGGGLKCLNW